MKRIEDGRYVVVDSETGEVKQVIGNSFVEGARYELLEPADKVIRGDPNNNCETKILRYDYMKFSFKAGVELYNKCKEVLLIIPYINYRENILKYNNGQIVNIANFAKHTGYSRTRITQVFRKLQKEQILKKTRINNRNVFMFNPFVGFKGKTVSVAAIEEFKNSDWATIAIERERKRER